MSLKSADNTTLETFKASMTAIHDEIKTRVLDRNASRDDLEAEYEERDIETWIYMGEMGFGLEPENDEERSWMPVVNDDWWADVRAFWLASDDFDAANPPIKNQAIPEVGWWIQPRDKGPVRVTGVNLNGFGDTIVAYCEDGCGYTMSGFTTIGPTLPDEVSP